MKPFDLEKALAGDPVVTRDGVPVEIYYIDAASREEFKVLAIRISDGSLHCFRGRDGQAGHISDFDLFMAPKKKTVYVNLYPDGMFFQKQTEEAAREAASADAIAVAVPVEIEV